VERCPLTIIFLHILSRILGWSHSECCCILGKRSESSSSWWHDQTSTVKHSLFSFAIFYSPYNVLGIYNVIWYAFPQAVQLWQGSLPFRWSLPLLCRRLQRTHKVWGDGCSSRTPWSETTLSLVTFPFGLQLTALNGMFFSLFLGMQSGSSQRRFQYRRIFWTWNRQHWFHSLRFCACRWSLSHRLNSGVCCLLPARKRLWSVADVSALSICDLRIFHCRPVAGYVNLCPDSIRVEEHDIRQMESTIRHEILHALVCTRYFWIFPCAATFFSGILCRSLCLFPFPRWRSTYKQIARIRKTSI
jgi:hypothetical protein